MFFGTGFPSALAKEGWRLRTVFLVGSADKTIGAVFFWFNRLGNGSGIFDVVDDFPSTSPILSELSVRVALDALDFSFSSALRLIRLVGYVTRIIRAPNFYPVGLARRFVGLRCCPAACSFLVSLFGKPVTVSTLNIGC